MQRVCSWVGAVVLLTGIVGCAGGDAIVVTEARLRTPLPGAESSVGYFTLENNTATDVRLIGANSTQIGAIEMHETVEVDGMLRMRRLREVRIGAQARLKFQSGGKHLMLFRLDELQPPVMVELKFADHPAIEVNFDIFAIGES